MYKILILLHIFVCPNLSAQDWFDDKKAQPDVEVEGTITYAANVRVTTPEASPMLGHTLRIDGVPFKVAPFIDIPTSFAEDEVEVELVAPDGRIVDYQYRTVTEDMLFDFKVRRFQFHLGMGYRHWDKSNWKDIGIDPSGSQLSFGFAYTFGALGFGAGLKRIRRAGKTTDDLLVEYESIEVPIEVFYEMVPYTDSDFWRQWHLRLGLGFVEIRHNFSLYLNESTFNPNAVDSKKNYEKKYGAVKASVSALTPLTDRVWFFATYSLMHTQLEIDELNLRTKKPISNLVLNLLFTI